MGIYLVRRGYMIIRTQISIDGEKVFISDYVKGKMQPDSKHKRMFNYYGI